MNDPSPENTLQHLDKQASRNQQYVRSLRSACEREMETLSHGQQASNSTSRLRQMLILMTGGSADTNLFVNGQNGEMLSSNQTYAMVADLSAPYRLESSPTRAAFRKLGRSLENVGSKAVGVAYLAAGAAELAAVGLAAYLVSASVSGAPSEGQSSPTLLQRVAAVQERTRAIQPSGTKSTTVAAALAALFLARNRNLHHSPWDNSVVKGVSNLVRSWTTLRLGAVVEELVADGVSDKTRSLMRRVAQSHKALDLEVQQLSDVDLTRRVEAFADTHSGAGSWLGSVIRTSTTQTRVLARLFRNHVHDKRTPAAVCHFRKLLQQQGLSLKGYHVCTCYGDPRSSVQDVMAAFLIQHEKEREALQQKLPTLIPNVAPRASALAASKQKPRSGGSLAKRTRRHSNTRCNTRQRTVRRSRSGMRWTVATSRH